MANEGIKDYTRGELIIHSQCNAGSTIYLGHGTFNDVVISRMFLEIDEDVATNTVKEYYSMLQAITINSASLKILPCLLNDKAYV